MSAIFVALIQIRTRRTGRGPADSEGCSEDSLVGLCNQGGLLMADEQ
jgi:hypothetical protein